MSDKGRILALNGGSLLGWRGSGDRHRSLARIATCRHRIDVDPIRKEPEERGLRRALVEPPLGEVFVQVVRGKVDGEVSEVGADRNVGAKALGPAEDELADGTLLRNKRAKRLGRSSGW